MRILILNGPNLNLLGRREPDTYGKAAFEEYFQELKNNFPYVHFDYYQSNVEGELINKLHECGFTHDGIIFNPGGYTHTSVAIGDAVAAIQSPVVEVHISNVMAREEIRHTSFIAKYCRGTISGFGLDGYRLAVLSLSSEQSNF
jgi:3-dehydroquinate dehydratase II